MKMEAYIRRTAKAVVEAMIIYKRTRKIPTVATHSIGDQICFTSHRDFIDFGSQRTDDGYNQAVSDLKERVKKLGLHGRSSTTKASPEI